MAGVYISWPFCAQKCTYCNFASGVFPRALETQYLEALCKQIDAVSWPWIPETVYLGGGTPGSMEVESLQQVLSRIPSADPAWDRPSAGRDRRKRRSHVEATLEAAPGAIDREHVEGWRALGINRVSLGVQSFVDAELRKTGRRHTAQIVADDVGLLRECGIGEINIDVIAGLPGQTRESWRASLDWIERLAPPHVSVYMFEIDEDSRLGSEILRGGSRYGAGGVPEEDAVASMYEEAVDRLGGIGLARYEISNFARPGHESRHNLKYWRLEPYFGFGVDAHSFDGQMRWQNPETIPAYVDAVSRDAAARESLTPAIQEEERFFVGLRLMEGVTPTPAEWAIHAEPIARLVENGLLDDTDGRLRLTARGVLLSNEVFQEFIGDPCPTN
jgi:oxygen-independent coproporphyrinogen-3 oxidase